MTPLTATDIAEVIGFVASRRPSSTSIRSWSARVTRPTLAGFTAGPERRYGVQPARTSFGLQGDAERRAHPVAPRGQCQQVALPPATVVSARRVLGGQPGRSVSGSPQPNQPSPQPSRGQFHPVRGRVVRHRTAGPPPPVRTHPADTTGLVKNEPALQVSWSAGSQHHARLAVRNASTAARASGVGRRLRPEHPGRRRAPGNAPAPTGPEESRRIPPPAPPHRGVLPAAVPITEPQVGRRHSPPSPVCRWARDRVSRSATSTP